MLDRMQSIGTNILSENETNKYRKSLLNLLIKMVTKKYKERFFVDKEL